MTYTYLIFPPGDTAASVLTRPVGTAEARFLDEVLEPRLRPMSEEEYLFGPGAILGTFARYSYVLGNGSVYWCVEWKPGLLVLRFSPSGAIAWCAVRSPNPSFGGRVATESELDAYDEDAPDPQYDLVFEAWDAQFDDALRATGSGATREQMNAWHQAMAVANRISARVTAFSDGERSAWLNKCKQSPQWTGDAA